MLMVVMAVDGYIKLGEMGRVGVQVALEVINSLEREGSWCNSCVVGLQVSK